MKDKIKARITELAIEAEALVNKRSDAERAIDECNVRLSQVIGAMEELNNLVSGENDETSTKLP